MKYLNVDVRKMEEKDLPAVLEIENLCFTAHWKEKDFHYEMYDNPVSNTWVIELESKEDNLKSVLGFVVFWETFSSATICQIAVHPGIQRHQLGSAMMDEVFNECYAKKISTITLEVRKSNQNAINFYNKHGFKQECIKPHYYSNGEDAIYMIAEVKI